MNDSVTNNPQVRTWHFSIATTALTPMGASDLDEVTELERRAAPFPWMRRHFDDALVAGYMGTCMRDAHRCLIGYSLVMDVLDERHLLNIAVEPASQGQGAGRLLLENLLAEARSKGCERALLEVRLSNSRAIELYRRHGFSEIGRRRDYYPGQNGREDALVMHRMLREIG